MSQMTLSATMVRAMKMEVFDDKSGIEMLDHGVGMMVDHTIEIEDVVLHDDRGDRSDDDDDGNVYEGQSFVYLDDVIEETYTEATISEQNSFNELTVDSNVTIIGDTSAFGIGRKKVRKQTNHQCDECGRVFSRKTVLEQHKNTHTGIKNFSCDICKSLFTRRSHLSIHMRIHENSKPYICEICSRGFRKSGDLARHRRIHFADRNYPCPMCEKRFKRATDVTSHMRTHTKGKPYTCKQPKCDKKYTSHSSLRKHEIRKHEKFLPDSAMDSNEKADFVANESII